eukprot:6410746-Amphidinium_carterae.1
MEEAWREVQRNQHHKVTGRSSKTNLPPECKKRSLQKRGERTNDQGKKEVLVKEAKGREVRY